MIPIVIRESKGDTNIEVASNWNELSISQLLYVAENWEAWKLLAQNDLSLLKSKAKLFLELICGNTPFNRKKRAALIAKIDNESLYQFTQLTNFIFEKNELTVCPIKSFAKLYAPNNELGNITAFEFAFADALFMSYMDNASIDKLKLLISTLYRPLEKGSKKRVEFDKDRVEQRLKAVRKLSYAEQQLILLWYIGCRNKIINDNKAVFSNSNQSEVKQKGWLDVILALAGDKFGTFEQTGNTDLRLIFMEIKELKNSQKQKKKGVDK